MTAIEFNNISKQYRLGLVSTRTLSHDLNRWWVTNVLRKEDPYLKIGETNDRSTKGESEYVWALRDIDFKVEQGAIMGMTKPEIRRKLDEIVDFAGVERYVDTPVKRYSSGMMVRLGFAIAAHLEPEILVVDEVLAVGDAEFQKKAIGKMQDVSKGEGRTVLFVSHNMVSLKNLCKNGVLLKNGRLVMSGDINSVVDTYIGYNQSNRGVVEFPKKMYKSVYRSYINKISTISTSNFDSKAIFKMGDDIGIDLECKILEPIDNININIRMNDSFGTGIAAWRTKEMGVVLKYDEKLRVRLIIKNLNVFDGIYNLSVALLAGNETIDFIDNLISFEIVPDNQAVFNGKSVSKSLNLIYTPCDWIQM